LVDLDRVPYLGSALRSKIKTYQGVPILDRALQSSIPNLHFVGITSAQSLGPVMRFVYGAKHAAAFLTAHLRAPARRRASIVARPAREAVLRPIRLR